MDKMQKEMLLMLFPELSEIQFIDVKTLGDDLAGYYYYLSYPEDPNYVDVCVTPLQKIGGSWKFLPYSFSSGFQKSEVDSVDAKAKEMVESNPDFRLDKIVQEL